MSVEAYKEQKMDQYFWGIDVGTYESRGILLNNNFEIIADCSVSHSMINPKAGWFEHDAEKDWWGDFCKLSREILKVSGINPKEIAGIGASTLGTDCLPVDENCRPLRNAILYGIDARSAEEIKLLNKYYGAEKVRKLFGHPICSGDTATKILWVRRNEPEIYSKTYKFLTGSSYITAKLTGEYVIDQFLAKGSFRPLYNKDGSINETESGIYCDPSKLCKTAFSTEVAGHVTPEAAEDTGLAEGTPVIAGTGDSTAESISAGLIQPGTVFFQFGSSMFFYYLTDVQINDFESENGNGKLKSGKEFTIPGTFCLGDGTNAAGTLTRWVRNTFYSEELEKENNGGENAYTVMASEAAETDPGSDGLIILPYIYGERSPIQDPDAKGIVFGLKGGHTRKHINRAALEGIGYSVYQHLLLFKEMNIPPKEIIVAGGGTKNETWMQIVCDMAGMPVSIRKPCCCSALGDAMLAALGIGRLKDFKDLKNNLPEGRTILPNEKNHKYYIDHYKIYRDLYLKTRDLMHLF